MNKMPIIYIMLNRHYNSSVLDKHEVELSSDNYLNEVSELETLRKLSFQDFFIKVGVDIRKMSKNFDKNCAMEFKEAVDNKYGMLIDAKWDDKKDTFLINIAIHEVTRIYEG
jgi:hypothetical protein